MFSDPPASAPLPVLRFCLGDDVPTVQQSSTIRIEHPPQRHIGLVALQGPVEVRYERLGEAPLSLPPARFVALKTIGGRVTSAEVNPQLAPLDEGAAIALCARVAEQAVAAGFRLDPHVTITGEELPYYLGEPGAALGGGVRARKLMRGSDVIDISIRRQSSPMHAVAQGAPADWFLVRVELENPRVIDEALASA